MKRLIVASIALAALAAAMPGVAHAEGMPQLEFGNPLLKAQVIWGAVIFLVFYVAVSRWGLPRVGAILDNRERVIGQDLEQARLAKNNADHAVSELTAARRRAYVESQAAVAEAAQKAKQDAAARAAEVNARLDRQLAEAESQIAAARASAMAALRGIADDTTAAMVARLTGREAGAGDVANAVGDVLGRRGLASA
jgi:F-type H+-transporting ATPase subunit b